METTIQDPNAPGALMLPPGEIERWVRDFHDERARSGGWPTIYVRKRDASNIALLLADEEETVSATTLAGARRTPVSAPFLAWLEALPEQARRRFAHPVTQREWTEARDSAASAALAECGVG